MDLDPWRALLKTLGSTRMSETACYTPRTPSKGIVSIVCVRRRSPRPDCQSLHYLPWGGAGRGDGQRPWPAWGGAGIPGCRGGGGYFCGGLACARRPHGGPCALAGRAWGGGGIDCTALLSVVPAEPKENTDLLLSLTVIHLASRVLSPAGGCSRTSSAARSPFCMVATCYFGATVSTNADRPSLCFKPIMNNEHGPPDAEPRNGTSR